MIHAFRYSHHENTFYFLWDIESGSLHLIDYDTYLVASYDNSSLEELEREDYNKLDNNIVNEIREELISLEKSGLINMPISVCEHHGRREIKALCLNICHDCNLKCKYCFGNEGTYNTARDYMSAEVAKASVDFLIANSGTRQSLEIDFFGGEPLMNMEAVRATIDYAREQAPLYNKTFNFTITTNGVLLNKENINYINANMYNVILSLDGREHIHDNARPTANGKGSYSTILPKMLNFAKERGDRQYYVRGTFTHNNLDFSSDVLHMNDLGFRQISVEPVVLPTDHPLAIQENDIPKLKKEYDSLATAYLDRRLDDKTWFNFFHFMIDLDNGPCITKRLTGCGAGSEYLAISPLGDIYPCHQFVGETDFIMGSVLSNTFDRNSQSIFRSINVLGKTECTNCMAKYFCSGGCTANAYHFNSDLNKPYLEACQLMRKRLELSLAIYAIEKYNLL